MTRSGLGLLSQRLYYTQSMSDHQSFHPVNIFWDSSCLSPSTPLGLLTKRLLSSNSCIVGLCPDHGRISPLKCSNRISTSLPPQFMSPLRACSAHEARSLLPRIHPLNTASSSSAASRSSSSEKTAAATAPLLSSSSSAPSSSRTRSNDATAQKNGSAGQPTQRVIERSSQQRAQTEPTPLTRQSRTMCKWLLPKNHRRR